MKPLLLCAVFAVCMAGGAMAQPPGPSIDSCALARDYADAFRAMKRYLVVVTYAGPDRAERVENVTRIDAHGATVLITDLHGGRRILDAARVIAISER